MKPRAGTIPRQRSSPSTEGWMVLVNNAGINDPAERPPSATSLDAVRRVFDANFFGALAVT